MVAFEGQLLLGVLGAGLPGGGEGLDRVGLGGARGGLGVTLAGGIGADMVVLGAGVRFGLPCPADLGAGVLAGLGGFGERGVPLGACIVAFAAGLGDGGCGLLADRGDLVTCLVAGGLRAGIGGVGVGAGAVGCFHRGPGIVAGRVHRPGGGPGLLDGSGGLGLGDGGLGLGLAAGGVRGGQRRADPARISSGNLGGRGGRQLGGLGQELAQRGERTIVRGALPVRRRPGGCCLYATCVSMRCCRTPWGRPARQARAARCRIRAACSAAARPARAAEPGQSCQSCQGLSFFSRTGKEKKSGNK